MSFLVAISNVENIRTENLRSQDRSSSSQLQEYRSSWWWASCGRVQPGASWGWGRGRGNTERGSKFGTPTALARPTLLNYSKKLLSRFKPYLLVNFYATIIKPTFLQASQDVLLNKFVILYAAPISHFFNSVLLNISGGYFLGVSLDSFGCRWCVQSHICVHVEGTGNCRQVDFLEMKLTILNKTDE